MGDHFADFNFGWSKSNGSEVSFGPFIEEFNSDSLVSEDGEAPFARHGLVLEADPENVDMKQESWSHYAFGFVLGYRKFLISYLQQLINNAWQIRGVATIVGRDSFFYLIHFEICVLRVHGPLMVPSYFGKMETQSGYQQTAP